MNSSKTLKMVEDEVNLKKILPENYFKTNKVMSIIVRMKDFELFICNFHNLVVDDVSEIEKRNIITPQEIIFKMKTYQGPIFEEKQWYYRTNYNINLGLTVIKLSYNDISSIKAIAKYQISLLKSGKKEEEIKEKELKLIKEQKEKARKLENGIIEENEEEIIKAENNIETENNKETEKIIEGSINPKLAESLYEVKIRGFQTIIVDDKDENLVPVFEIEIFQSNVNFLSNNFKSIMDSNLSISCSYFNPGNSRWEPFIEKVGFNAGICFNPAEISPNSKVFIFCSFSFSIKLLNFLIMI